MTHEERIKSYTAARDAGMTAAQIAEMTGETTNAIYIFCSKNGIKMTHGKGRMTDQQRADLEVLRNNGVPEAEARKIVTAPRKKVPMWVTPQQAAEARQKLGLRA